MTADPRTQTAWHESSHAIMAWLLGFEVKMISIRPGAHYSGITSFGDGPNVGLWETFDGMTRRRNADTFLGRIGLAPPTLWPAEDRRRLESSIMVTLSGDMGELLAAPFESAFRQEETVDEAETTQLARRLASQPAEFPPALSDAQRERLERTERTEFPNDEARAMEDASSATGDILEAIALKRYLQRVTRNIVFTEAFYELLTKVTPLLLEHTVLDGGYVADVLERATESKRRLRLVASKAP